MTQEQNSTVQTLEYGEAKALEIKRALRLSSHDLPCLARYARKIFEEGAAEQRRKDADGQKPVAWNYYDEEDDDGRGGWRYSSSKPSSRYEDVHPLYTHPANVAALEARIADLEDQERKDAQVIHWLAEKLKHTHPEAKADYELLARAALTREGGV